jgi:hypothetical protein
MKELSEDEVQLVVRALEHSAAYLIATQREDRRYQALAERLQRKGPGKVEPERAVKKKRAS